MKKVEIYTGQLCAFCKAAKALLVRNNISFEEIDISNNPEKREEMLSRSNSSKTIPQIFIGNNHIGGYEQLRNLEKEKKLDSLLKN